jgi:hypothetical protein
MTLALPERGFGRARMRRYRYWFVPPHSCAGARIGLAPPASVVEASTE